MFEGLILSGLWIKKHLPINAISDTFEGQCNFVLYDAEKKLVLLLLQEYECIVNEIETLLEIKRNNYYTTTRSKKCKQLEEKHIKFRQQLENK